MSYTLPEYYALKAAIASGTQSVTYGDKSVTYRPLDEMIQVLNLMETELFPDGATSVKEGRTISYTVAGTAINKGDIRMIGDVTGVAMADGAVGETIKMSVTGVYELPKGSEALAQGTAAYVNITNGVTTIVGAATGNKLCGHVWEDAPAGADSVLIKLN